jgi:hypothetical protein
MNKKTKKILIISEIVLVLIFVILIAYAILFPFNHIFFPSKDANLIGSNIFGNNSSNALSNASSNASSSNVTIMSNGTNSSNINSNSNSNSNNNSTISGNGVVGPGNFCKLAVSLNDIKSACGVQEIKENNLSSYYLTADSNFVLGYPGTGYSLGAGEVSRCMNTVNTLDFDLMSKKGAELIFVVYDLNSKEIANQLYAELRPNYNQYDTLERSMRSLITLTENVSGIGEKCDIAELGANSVSYDQNSSITLKQSASIYFLKEKKVVWMRSSVYDSNTKLLCDVDGLKNLAMFIASKIN